MEITYELLNFNGETAYELIWHDNIQLGFLFLHVPLSHV